VIVISKEMTAAIERAIRSVPEGDRIRSMQLFGSRLRGDHTTASDYDFLVVTDGTIGIFAFVGIKHALEDALGAKVDLCTPQGIHPVLKNKVLSSAKTVYER